ncbi:LysM domain-containing protein [Actinopolymorpha sp. B17G11]|uniref:LysM domain-containing protein n=1 Tax=unclassified Actinopolymorpha TaxID=2627063 RepID=UPI0032D96FD0
MAAGSRYDGVEIATATVPDGAGGSREVRYLRRRAVPDPAAAAPMALHAVAADDRLDLVTARYLGDPAAFWRIADANAALDPDALVGPDAEGALLVIPVPGM